VEELATLPGITDRLARSIVERRGSARFEKVEELTEIRGISQKTLDGLRDLVSLD
jgi:DNA uptake protein ComE-like DNA-binding protein